MDFISAVIAICLGILVVIAGIAAVILIGFYLIAFVLWALVAGINAIFKKG
jgi:hypothetical protein